MARPFRKGTKDAKLDAHRGRVGHSLRRLAPQANIIIKFAPKAFIAEGFFTP